MAAIAERLVLRCATPTNGHTVADFSWDSLHATGASGQNGQRIISALDSAGRFAPWPARDFTRPRLGNAGQPRRQHRLAAIARKVLEGRHVSILDSIFGARHSRNSIKPTIVLLHNCAESARMAGRRSLHVRGVIRKQQEKDCVTVCWAITCPFLA